jgi:hypothetical protein
LITQNYNANIYSKDSQVNMQDIIIVDNNTINNREKEQSIIDNSYILLTNQNNISK